MANRELDATGLKCPMPVLRARRVLKAMASGEVLQVRADDLASAKDFPAFCEQTGNRLEASEQQGEMLLFRIRKA